MYMKQLIEKQLKPWGNANAVVIPKSFMDKARWTHDQIITMTLVDDTVTLSPVRPQKTRAQRLASMLDGVTPELVGGEHGASLIGKEIL